MYIVIVRIIPLNGCQKYGYVTMNQPGSRRNDPGWLMKYGTIDFWTMESTINRLSLTASLRK